MVRPLCTWSQGSHSICCRWRKIVDADDLTTPIGVIRPCRQSNDDGLVLPIIEAVCIYDNEATAPEVIHRPLLLLYTDSEAVGTTILRIAIVVGIVRAGVAVRAGYARETSAALRLVIEMFGIVG